MHSSLSQWGHAMDAPVIHKQVWASAPPVDIGIEVPKIANVLRAQAIRPLGEGGYCGVVESDGGSPLQRGNGGYVGLKFVRGPG